MKYLFLCLAALPSFAAENAILSNGFRMRVERHETNSGKVRLHTASGIIELPEASVLGFELEDYVPPVQAAAQTEVVAIKIISPALTVHELVEQAAVKAGLPPAIVHSVAKAESGYRADAVSPKGAVGLMQLMPATAAERSVDPRNPKENAEAGAMYLRELLIKYDGDVPKALAAYNAGPGAVQKYNGVPPYAETRSYVNRVLRDYKKRSAENLD